MRKRADEAREELVGRQLVSVDVTELGVMFNFGPKPWSQYRDTGAVLWAWKNTPTSGENVACEHNWILHDLKLMCIFGEAGIGQLTMPRERSAPDLELTWHEMWFCPDCRKVEARLTPADPQ